MVEREIKKAFFSIKYFNLTFSNI